MQREKAGAGGGVEDRLGVDTVGPVEVGDVAGLAKTVDPDRHDPVAGYCAEPLQCRRVKVADCDQRGAGP